MSQLVPDRQGIILHVITFSVKGSRFTGRKRLYSSGESINGRRNCVKRWIASREICWNTRRMSDDYGHSICDGILG